MNVVGFDLSLSAPGVAYDNSPATMLATRLTGPPRLAYRARQVIDVLDAVRPAVVVIEGYATGRTQKTAGARSIGELGGVIRLIFHERRLPFAQVPPSTLKKYATGNGAADKAAVISAAIAAGAAIPTRPKAGGGREYDDNAADAWWLWQMGLAHYVPGDDRIAAVGALNRESLNSVRWPRLSRKVPA